MTLFDFEELTAYWVEHPPLHIVVEAYLGAGRYRPKRVSPTGSTPGHEAGSDLQALLAELGPGFGAGDVHAGLPDVVLDFAELRRRARSSN
jgi:NAD(P)H-dependent FMN reductase